MLHSINIDSTSRILNGKGKLQIISPCFLNLRFERNEQVSLLLVLLIKKLLSSTWNYINTLQAFSF